VKPGVGWPDVIGSRRIVARLFTTLVGASLLLAGAAAGTLTGRSGELVVTLNPASGGGPDQIWLIDPAGRLASRRLPTGPAINIDPLSPRFLPSGQQVVFTAPQQIGSPWPTAVGVMIVNASGSGLRQIGAVPVPLPQSTTYIGLPGRLAVDPAGGTVATAFVEARKHKPETDRIVIEYFNVRRRRQTGSASVAGFVGLTTFDWLPDGELLLMGTNTSARSVTEVVRMNGSLVRRIAVQLPSAATVTDAAPSPDGASIAFTEVIQRGQCGEQSQTVYEPCPSDIYTVGMSGGQPRRLTFTNSASSPVWSPDGSRLAFETSLGRSDELLTLATGRVSAIAVRIPRGGVNLADWQPLSGSPRPMN
jgi:hypothetical protein